MRQHFRSTPQPAHVPDRATYVRLQDRWDKLRQVIEERAASPDFANIPGGKTGLLCKVSKAGRTRRSTKVDTALLAEMRAHEQQAAQELRQWQTRSAAEEPKVIDVTPATMTLAMVMTAAELEELFGADGPAQ